MLAALDLLRLLRDVPGAPSVFLREEYDRIGGRMLALAGWYRRRWIRSTRVVAVVGSLGKTTTTGALRAALACPDRRFSYSNYGASLAENLLRVRRGDAHAVLEVGVSRPGPMAGYARRLQPDVVVVTSIASDHNRSFPTLLDTRAEKVRMIRELGPERTVVLNGDDPNVRWMASQTRARVVTCGAGKDNDVRAVGWHALDDGGGAFAVEGLAEPCTVRTRLAGEHMLFPPLAALVVASLEGVDLGAAIARLAALAPAVSRLEAIALPGGVVVIDDSYKASLESILAALAAFERLSAERKIAVLGPVQAPIGPHGDLLREIGRRAGRFAARIVCIGHRMTGVRAGAVESGMSRDAVHLVGPDLDAGLAILRETLRAGDAVLIKGRANQRLRRIVLALQGRAVACKVSYCKVKTPSCDVCPVRDAPPRVFENRFVARSIRL